MEIKKECLDCKYCAVEDLWYELICLKHNKDLCPTYITDEYDIYYPACKDYEEKGKEN